MDPILTPAIVILAKSIIDTLRKDRSPGSLYVGKYESHSTDSSDHTATATQICKKKSQEEADMKLIENVVERIKKELPDIIEKMHKVPPTVIPDSLDSIYISQITAAQEFINNNRKADLSQIKCILRKMLPKEYHEKIDELKEYQDPKIININGGQNLIAPNAKNAKQDIQKKV